jgi:outer membrane protein assembly factor BamA
MAISLLALRPIRPLWLPMVLLLVSCAGAAPDSLSSPSLSPQGKRIAHIFFNGNHVTKESTLRCFLRIDTGMVYDSIHAQNAKRRLMRTGLFSKVNILTIVKKQGCDLYLVVQEKGYLHIPLPGIYQYSRKYGREERWFFGDAGFDIDNFGGHMERLRLSLRAWEWRTLGIGWTKPVLPSRYFFGIGVYGDQRPDEFFPFDRTDVSGGVGFGADLFSSSKISFNASPMFRRAAWHDSTGQLDYYQAYGSINWSTDCRESLFDPSNGWVLKISTLSNYLYSHGNTPYVQQRAAFSFYHPGFFENDKFACRFVATVRDKNAGYLNRLGIGGEGSVRGYGRNVIGIGLPEIPNNSFIISAEYRFSLYTFFPIPVPFSSIVSPFIGSHKTLSPRIDAALIADYGRIAPRINDLASRDGNRYESGTGLGFGLRLLEPVLQMCGCIDVVFADIIRTSGFDLYPIPGVHMYTNLPF